MKKYLLLSVLATFLFTQSLYAQVPPGLSARLQTVLDSVCNRLHIKGTSAAVLIPGVGTWKGVNGVSHAGQPITTDMMFGIGSNTKTYVAALMLQMEERGQLSIDDTIGRWIQNQPNISGAITIRQLLNHTSGLFDYTQAPHWVDSVFADVTRIWQPEEVYQFIGAPYFTPGLKHDYCNTNYLLAGLIIKQVMNQSAGTALRSSIFTPQSLNNTIFFPEQSTSLPIPHAWSYKFIGSLEDLTSTGYSHNAMFSMASTAGCIMTTAEENVQFWHKLFSGQIINSTSMDKMRTFVGIPGTSIATYGLGLYRYRNFNGRVIYSHGGTNIGFINENAVDSASGVVITALTNQDSIRNNTLLNNVVRALHKVITIDAPPTAIPQTNAVTGIRLYPNPATTVLHIHNEQDGMVCILTDIAGKTAITTPLKKGMNDVPVTQLNNGFYTATFQAADGRRVSHQPILIQH